MARKTIVALYDRRAEAEAVRQQLLDAGFDDLNIEVVADGGFGGSNDYHGGLFVLLSGWGVPAEEAHEYAEGVRQGGALVTVSLLRMSAIQRALSVLEPAGTRSTRLEEAAAAMRDVNAAPAPAQAPAQAPMRAHAPPPQAAPTEGQRVGVYPIPDSNEGLGPTGRRRES
ncbi:hypothetical protein [Azospirillum soli]|uniref:hypothetical protein n=1 Tax=Azospirillum soli TaxID=1304799 RepID=UPI001AE4A0D5|nr:hypothetical protein [Azospirillum soli]MBP2312213.1 hypothetical protein [Azospirillum soli]